MQSRAILMVLICLFSITVLSHSDSPPENTIPIVGLKANYEDIDTDFFCFLSWHNFDGLSRQFYHLDSILTKVALPGDTTGMLTVVGPWIITSETQVYSHMFEMDTDSAFAWPVWNGYTYQGTTYTEDGLLDERSPADMAARMEWVAEELEEYFNDRSHSVWFYYGYDEAPAWQWTRMVTDSVDGVYSEYIDYMPNLFTLEMDSVLRNDIDSTMKWQPTFEHVDYYGVLSWMGWYINQADSTREKSFVISNLHTIKEWADYTNIIQDNDSTPGNFSNQAQVVRSLFSMHYRGYKTSGDQPDSIPNNPSFIALDAYPFRLVGTQYQIDYSYTPQLGSSLDNWMLDHYDEGMDSTFITAWNIRNDESKDISVFFVPQAFGRAGGGGMRDTIQTVPPTYVLDYVSYNYRIPTPQEFLMTCNSSLILQAKAILPYCLTSYWGSGGNLMDVGLLDQNNIPYDAPYEEWVYRDRPTDSISFIPPDQIQPFISGYDPLYTHPLRPTPSGEKATEILLEWKFAAYGRLWNSVRETFSTIARVAPELALLEWWEDNENDASMSYDGIAPSNLRTQIQVFTDSTESDCYLYYLNKFCRANDNPFEIVVDENDFFPTAPPFSEYALDHSRRFIIEGSFSRPSTYTFLDTLDAGEARLLQMFDDSEGLDADIRITDPDLRVILPAKGDTLLDYSSTPGTTIDILASFYNMGTASTGNTWVFLYDETNDEKLDSTRINIDGLSTGSCYSVAREIVTFNWTPIRTDIGVHILKIYADSISGEDATDNIAGLVYVVNPCDYATKILDDPWDMTEATGTPHPVWNTDDIVGMTGWNLSAYSDSISGMFEGGISNPTNLNRMFLNTGSGSSDWINADDYINLSLAGKATYGLDITLHWIDSLGDTCYIDTGLELTSTWQELDPVDLSNITGSDWEDSVTELWLEFGGGSLPVDVRIGWIKLTE